MTKFEWTNPHARFYIDVKGENGKVTNWNLELASPNVLGTAGLDAALPDRRGHDHRERIQGQGRVQHGERREGHLGGR